MESNNSNPAAFTTDEKPTLADVTTGSIAAGATSMPRVGARNWRALASEIAIKIVFVLFLLALWSAAHYYLVTKTKMWSPALFPAPQQVASWLWNEGFGLSYFTGNYEPPPGARHPGSYWEVLRQADYPLAIWASILRLMEGYIIAVVIGFPLGLLVARFTLAEKTIGWLSLSLQALPSICWIPLALLWLGRVGAWPILFVTIMGSLFATVVAVADGIRNVPPLMARAGRTLGATGPRLYFLVLLPAALPGIVTGLKIGWSFAWRSLMAAELIVPGGGLGFLLQRDRREGDPQGVLATILVIIVIGLAVQAIVFAPFERRLQALWGLTGTRASAPADTGISLKLPRFNSRSTLIFAGVMCLVFVASAALWSLNRKGTGKRAEVTQVIIGYTPTIALPQPLIGVENGEYARHISGVQFSSYPLDSGAGVVEALRAGVIQIGASGPYPALTAFAKNGDIVLLSNAANGGTELMVRRDTPLKTVKDLKGKVVGVNQLGSTVDAMVRYNLVKAGLVPDKDVRIIEIEPAEQATELKRGDVAAVAAPAPWPSFVALNGNARPLLDWKQILADGKYSAGSLYTTKDFAAANPQFIHRFLEANRTLTARLNADRTQGDKEVLAAWSNLTKKKLAAPVARAAFATIEYNMAIDEKALQNFADIAHDAGILKQKANLKGFVYKAP